MVEEGTLLFILFRLTRAEARGPTKLRPLFVVLDKGSILGDFVEGGIGGFGGRGRLWWREIILVWSAVVLFPKNGSVRVSSCGDEASPDQWPRRHLLQGA